jgi:hypothetical protein
MLPPKNSCSQLSNDTTNHEKAREASRSLTVNAEASDVAEYSVGVASEMSLTERDFKMSNSLKRLLEDAFNDLEQQIRLNGRHTIMSMT